MIVESNIQRAVRRSFSIAGCAATLLSIAVMFPGSGQAALPSPPTTGPPMAPPGLTPPGVQAPAPAAEVAPAASAPVAPSPAAPVATQPAQAVPAPSVSTVKTPSHKRVTCKARHARRHRACRIKRHGARAASASLYTVGAGVCEGDQKQMVSAPTVEGVGDSEWIAARTYWYYWTGSSWAYAASGNWKFDEYSSNVFAGLEHAPWTEDGTYWNDGSLVVDGLQPGIYYGAAQQIVWLGNAYESPHVAFSWVSNPICEG